jgi:hypothetical protein
MRRFTKLVALVGALTLGGLGAGTAFAWEGYGCRPDGHRGAYHGGYEYRQGGHHGDYGGHDCRHEGYPSGYGEHQGRPGITLYFGPPCGPSIAVPFYGHPPVVRPWPGHHPW